jgi:hypothetical protein
MPTDEGWFEVLFADLRYLIATIHDIYLIFPT